MKLGKKVLSCVLAIMMIVTSVSVCFTSFAVSAESQLKNLYNQINMDYDGLLEAIDSKDPARVPTNTSGGIWVVERDTYHSGWYNLAKAFASYAKAVTTPTNSVNTVDDVVQAALTGLDEINKYTGATKEEVTKVLGFFTKMSPGSNAASYRAVLNIKAGIDYLAWAKIADIETSRNYFEGSLEFRTASKGSNIYGLTPDTVTFATTSDSTLTEAINGKLRAIKAVLGDMVKEDAFKTWFNLDFSSMTVEEVMELVSGTHSVANVLRTFTDAAKAAGFEDEGAALWDHYVAGVVGKKYAETKAWIEGSLMDAIYVAYAGSYQREFEEKMAVDYSAFTAAEILAHYNSVMEIKDRLENQEDYNQNKIFTNILPFLDGKNEFYSKTVTEYIKTLTVDVAKFHAKEYADALDELVNREVPTYDHESESASAAWPGSEDEAKAKQFIADATSMKTNIDTFILGFGTFEDVKNVFSVDGKNRVTEEAYKALSKKIDLVKVDVDGFAHFENKAKMDSFIAGARFGGKSYQTLTSMLGEFKPMYDMAVNSKANQVLFDAVYPDNSFETYTDFLYSIYDAIAVRVYDQIKRVSIYQGEGGRGVAYYNFESIISAWEGLDVADSSAVSNLFAQVPEYRPSKGIPSLTEIENLYEQGRDFYNEALRYRTALKGAITHNGTPTEDQDILSYVFGKNDYSFISAVGQLDLKKIETFVNNIGLKVGNVNITELNKLMTAAVKDFDKMVVSKDLGSILGSLIPNMGGEGSEGMGTWEYAYDLKDPETGRTVHKNAGDPIETIREFLVNTILKLLYSGNLQTMLFTTIYPALGGVLSDSNTIPNVSAGPITLETAKLLPGLAAMALPSMPNHFWWNTTKAQNGKYDSRPADDGVYVQWKQFFTGERLKTVDGRPQDYTAILKELVKVDVQKYTSVVSVEYSKWVDGNGNSNFNFDNIDGQTQWHIQNAHDLYCSLAAAFCGLSVPLAVLLDGQSEQLYTKKVTFMNISLTLKMVNLGDSIYDRLFVPLYRLLGIEESPAGVAYQEGKFHNKTDLKNNALGREVMPNTDGLSKVLVNSGYNMWKFLLEPIMYWLDNKLFANPVETILEVLPNLLAAIEYNQIIPKLKNLVVDIQIDSFGIGSVYKLAVWDLIGGLGGAIGDILNALSGGIDGLLNALIKARATTTAPSSSNLDQYLQVQQKDADGTPKVDASGNPVMEVVTYKDGSRTYYFDSVGLLTPILYKALGSGVIDWIFGGKLANGKTSKVPLNLPVNRMMSAGTVSKYTFNGFKGNVPIYHITPSAGDALLTLFRWLLDEGTIQKILPLIGGLLPPRDDGTTILDTIIPIVDGQADNILAVIICLLNEYNVAVNDFQDPAKNEPNKFVNNLGKPVLNNGQTLFKLGDILSETLTATGVEGESNDTMDKKLAKADLAIENLDTVITSFFPMILTLVGDALKNNTTIAPYLDAVNFDEVAAKVKTGEIDNLAEIVGEMFVTNEFVSTLMELLFGTKEMKDVIGEDGTVIGQEKDNGLLGGLLSNTDGIVGKILPLLAQFGLDVSPLGFFNNAVKAGASNNPNIANWLRRQAAKFDNSVSTTAALAKMSWADVGVEENFTWFDAPGFDTYAKRKTSYTNFFNLIEQFISVINPILALLTTGEDITFLDELTIQGNMGYSRGIVPILEAVGLHGSEACMTQSEFNKLVYTGSKTGTNANILNADGSVKDKVTGADRFYEVKVSPLHPLFTALVELFIGNGKTDATRTFGLLEKPVTMLATNLPNIAYMLYTETEEDAYGEKIKQPNNLTVAVENLISPVLQVLEIADPILSRVISLDIKGLLRKYLDVETLLNDLLSGLIGKNNEEADEDQTAFFEILDFAELAAFSAKSVNTNAPSYRYDSNKKITETTTATRFEVSQGQCLITLLRQVLSPDLVNFIADMIKQLFTSTDIVDQETLESFERITKIVASITSNLNQSTADGSYNVDILTGIIIDILTNYNPDEGTPFFYEAERTANDWKSKYGIVHEDWWDTHKDATLKESQVNDAIANIDYVIKNAIPDVMKALTEEGVLTLPEQFDLSKANSLWELVETMVNDGLFNDAMITKLFNLILGLLGSPDTDQKTMDIVLSVLKAAGFDITPATYLFTADGTLKTQNLAKFLAVGVDKNADGTPMIAQKKNSVYATINGKEVELTWKQICLNHTETTTDVKKDEDGNDVVDENGNPVYETKLVDFAWGLDDLSTDKISKDFTERKSLFIDILWDLIAPFAKVFSTLFANDSLKLFNDGVTIRGNKGYETIMLPLLNAFGLTEVLDYVNRTEDASGNGKTILETINETKTSDNEKIQSALMSSDEYYALVYPDGQNFSSDGMKKAISQFADYVFYFVEILLNCPVSTLATALPTLAYFIYGDGLTTLVSNILIPVTTLTNRLDRIVKLDINAIGAGLIDMLATGSWKSFQEALQSYIWIDENGNIQTNYGDGGQKSFTDSLFNFIANLELDLSGILATAEEKENGMTDEQKAKYKFSIVFFIDNEAELNAKKQLALGTEAGNASAKKYRLDALKNFFKKVAALGDEVTNPLSSLHGYVEISKENGQVKVSKAAVLMFIVQFACENTALADIINRLVPDVNVEVEGVINLDVKELINNVLQNPDVLVQVIVDLVTNYEVNAVKDIELMEIETEVHYNFFEDEGYASIEDVLEELEKNPDKDLSTLSRVHTNAAIDNLDSLVGSVLGLFREQLVGENGILKDLGFTKDSELTLKAAVDTLLKNFVFKDEQINKLFSLIVEALGAEKNKKIVNIILTIVDGAGYSLLPQTIKKNVPALADVIGDAKKWNQVASNPNNLEFVYEYKDGEATKTIYSKNANETEIDGKAVTPVMVETTDADGNTTSVQKQAVQIHATYGITSRDEFIDFVWSVLKPLAGILEALLTEGSLKIYDKVQLRGSAGYKGVILPIANAFAVDSLVNSNGDKYLNNFYADYDSFKAAQKEDQKLILTSITDIVFAFVDSLCERPMNTLLTVLPNLARYIESNGVDVILENLIAPITTILTKIDKIYSLDLMGIVKNLLQNLVKNSNKEEGIETVSLEPEDQKLPNAALAAYVLNIIESSEGSNRSVLANVLNSDIETIDDPSVIDSEVTFLDILWQFLYSFEINGISLRGLIPDTIFTDIASCVYLPGSFVPQVEINADRTDGSIVNQLETDKIVVDRESVLINILNIVVFTDEIRNLIAELAKLDFDSLKTATEDNKDFLVCLIYGIFNDPEAVENLVITLLSWYNIDYKPVRTQKDYSDIETKPIDYNKIGLDKEQLNKLPSDLDSLLEALAPTILDALPEDLLGGIKFQGTTLPDIVKNLAISFIADSTETVDGKEVLKEGVATKLMSLLVNLVGGNQTVGMVISILGEAIEGLDLSLAYFKQASDDMNKYFADCETWADAYEAHKVLVKEADEEAGTPAEYKVVLENTDSFGLKTYEDVKDFLTDILTPFVPVLKVLFSNKNLVVLDGISIKAGDGYDRFLVPVLEVIGIDGIMDSDKFNALENEAYAAQVITYIDALINRILESPISFIVDGFAQLLFFVYSGGLQQALEQLVAPIVTLVDLVNRVLANRFKVEGNSNELYALDIYKMLFDLIRKNETIAKMVEGADDIYGLIEAFTNVDKLEKTFDDLIAGTDINLGFEFDGIFKTLIEQCCTISDVKTVRHFGATQKGAARYVKGVSSDRADTIIGIISDFILKGDMIKSLLNQLGVKTEGTIDTILDAVTGENRYVIFEILLKYFNEYDVETMVLEYLSFDKIDYIYSDYLDGMLSQRKLRRAIRKLDASLNSAIPGLIPMLSDLIKDNDQVKDIVNTLTSKNVQNLSDAVEALLESFAFKDSLVDDLAGKLVGLLGGEDVGGVLATVIPLVKQIVGIDLAPANFAVGTSALSVNIQAAIDAAPKFETDENGDATETPHEATWTDVANYFAREDVTLTWGIDSADTFEAKKDAFIEIFADLVLPLEKVLNVLLRGEDLSVPDGVEGSVTIQGNNGYENAVYPLAQILLNDVNFAKVMKPADYMAAKGTTKTLTAVTDVIFMFVEELCEGPVEYILTLLPKLSYALSNNGVEVIVSNLVSPVLAIYRLAEPVVGNLLEDLLGKAIGNSLKPFMPATAGKEVTKVETNEDGETTEIKYWVYSLDEIMGIAGEDGSNIIKILNTLLSGLLVKGEDGSEHEVLNLLKPSFFTDYAQHTITVNKSTASSKWYYWVGAGNKKVAADDYNYTTDGEIKDQRYVVSGFKVDTADSLIYLLDSVLSPDIIYAIAHLLNVDVEDTENMVSVLLNNLANGEMSAFVVADIITKIIVGYEVKYPVHHDILTEIDHSGYETLNDEQKEKLDQIPAKLDTVVEEAIPALLPMIMDLLAPKADEEGNTPEPSVIYTMLQSYVDSLGDEKATIAGLVNSLLDGKLYTNELLTMLARLLPSLFGSEIVEIVLQVVGVAGIKLDPQSYLKTIKAKYTGAKYQTAVTAVENLIGSATKWSEVNEANKDQTGDIAFGITDKDSFITAASVLLEPFFPVLQVVTQGKVLELFGYTHENYKPADKEPDIDGYLINLSGINAYDQVLMPIIDALRGTIDIKNIKSVEEFNNIDNLEDMLSYLFNLILDVVNSLANDPISFLSKNLASLVYFFANDGVYNVVENALAIVNVLAASTDAIYEGGEGLRIHVNLLKLADTGNEKGLLSLINDAIANAGLGLVITQDMLLSLAGKLGDYQKLDSYRTTADGALINENGRLVNVNGELLTADQLEPGKITTIIGDEKYVLTGLLDFALDDAFLGKLLEGKELPELVNTIIDNLTAPDGVSKVVNVVIKLFFKYVLNYKQYAQPELDKISIDVGDGASLEKLNQALANLDNILPIIFSLIGDGTATSLKDIVYPLFIKDDIANLLVSTITKLLSGLPSETIDMIIGLVNDLTNLKTISLAPQAFAKSPYGSKLGAYIGNAKSWAEVWEAHSHKDENGEAVADAYEWGIKTPADFIALISDMLLPLDDVLALLLTGKNLSALKEINVIGGDGYNHAIIPLLELLGIDNVKTQAKFEADEVKANKGHINYILNAVFGRLDEILEDPISNVLSLVANLAYVIGNDSVETFVYNLLAPVNELLKAVDPIFPIAIAIDLGQIGVEGGEIIKTALGTKHPGMEAGITLKASGKDISALIDSVIGGIQVNGQPLGIKLNLDWLKVAAQAAAEGENGKIKFTDSSFVGDYEYKNVVGDNSNTLMAILKAVLTKENVDAILKLLGKEDGLGEPLDSIIDMIIEDPSKILELIEALVGANGLTYIPIQNRLITPVRYDYSKYLALTEQNADLIAGNLDKVISDILVKAGYSSIKSLVAPLFAKSDLINTLLDTVVGLLGGDTVNTVLETLAQFCKDGQINVDLDLTVDSFYTKLTALNDYKNPGAVNIKAGVDKLKGKTSWAEVGSFEGTDWGFQVGDINGFVRVLGDILTPLNSVLELLLIGEDKELNVLDIIKLQGGNGYDLAIIPILEAFGYKADEVKNFAQYKKAVANDESQLLGYILDMIANFANKLLDKPVDTLLEILPNVAYFISNEGIYLAVRNLAAPLYSIIEIVTSIFGINLEEFLNISKLLHNINIPIELLGAKYGFRIPEIDFYQLATKGGSKTEERATARSEAAYSFKKTLNPHPYIDEYNKTDKYNSYEKKSTQTYVVSDKGDTLTLVLTWLLNMFGDEENRIALADWIAGVFKLNDQAKAQVLYGIDHMFDYCSRYGVSDLIVGALFQILAIAVVIEPVFTGDVQQIQKIFKDIFATLAQSKDCPYGSIAQVMDNITGVFIKNFGDQDDFNDAKDEVEESLNWFQKIIKAIRDFFRKIFGIK